MSNLKSSRWVATVFNSFQDKIESHYFTGDQEDEVYNKASTWVRLKYKDEKEYNWSLHREVTYTR
tara:strand:+ start:210 stop:404 length:195 start_codon:yes stop_codon:yes gene_type:complete